MLEIAANAEKSLIFLLFVTSIHWIPALWCSREIWGSLETPD